MVQVKVQPQIGETIQGQGTGSYGESMDSMSENMSPTGKNERVISSIDLPSQSQTQGKEMPGSSPEENGEEGTPKKNSHWLVWLVIILVLVAAGVAAYYFIFKK